MKKLSLLFAIIGLGLVGTLNAQSIQGNTQNTNAKNKVIKSKIFSPLFGNLGFAYEQQIKESISGEASFGLIGIGFDPFDVAAKSGFYLSAGPRFYLGQDWTMEGMENIAMRGFYFKPELLFSTYKSSLNTDIIQDLSRDYRATSGAIIFNMGRQYIAADIITIELSAGLGYGFSNHKYTEIDQVWEEVNFDNPRFYSHLQGGDRLPIAGKADITIGILLR